MFLLAQRSAVHSTEAVGLVFLRVDGGHLVCLIVFLTRRRRKYGMRRWLCSYDHRTALIAFLDMPVVGALVALPGVAYSFSHFYSGIVVRR
jgi:hypothetical protein